MIAADMIAILIVLFGVGLVIAGLAIGWDQLQYQLAARHERRQALQRARRNHPAGRSL